MNKLLKFIEDTVRTPRGRPPDLAVNDRIELLDDRMRLIEAVTWTLVPAAAVIGATAFSGIIRTDHNSAPAGLARRSAVFSWSLVAIAMAKTWHAQEQHHVEVMKELLVQRT